MNCLNSAGEISPRPLKRVISQLLPSLAAAASRSASRVAIDGLLLVAHAEERGFQHEEVAVMDQMVEEAEEISDQQVADVQAVHVGVGGEDDLLVAEALEVVLDVEAAHEVVHFVVLIDDVALEVPDVERLAFEDEDGLGVDVAATDDRAGGGLAFGEEDHRAFAFAFGLVEMELAVLELGDADGDGLGALAGQLLDLLQFLAQLAGVLDLGDDLFGDFLVAIEEMEQFLAHAVDQVGADFGVAELVLGLRLEDRVLEPDGHGADHALAHVVAFEFLVAIFVDGLEQALAEGAQVGAAVAWCTGR